jgi:uncharacterized protein DUF4145
MGKEFLIFSFTPKDFGVVPAVCPECGKAGSFDPLGGIKDIFHSSRWVIGFRRCPDYECRQLILFMFDRLAGSVKLKTQWPPSRIEFKTESVPENIISTLQEAIDCHSNQCWRAGATMVRRTLEEICDDNNAKGEDLFQRIEALKDKVVIAPALFEGMHGIRFLGNDAVHLELKQFDEVGDEELAVSIEITKQIIGSIYQSDALVNRLNALKKPPAGQ